MTEAKSPREIAEELAALIGRLEKDEPSYITTKAEDETIAFLKRNGRNFLSYAAERKRLLADADRLIAEFRLGGPVEWDDHSRRLKESIERHRLSSRPATGDD